MSLKIRKALPFLRHVKDVLLIALGITSATFGLEAFILPNHFIDGGVTGISLLLEKIFEQYFFHVPVSFFLIVLNLPFVYLGYSQVSKLFALKSLIAISILAVVLLTIHFPILTHDKLLTSVFGGFLLGAGIGFAMRGGGVIDGTEILAIALSRRTGLGIGDIILLINIVIFLSGIAVLGLEPALYSVLTYLSAAKTVDFILHGIEEYIEVTIMSGENEAIRLMIIEEMGYGVTVYKGTGGKSNEPIDVLSTVITRLEVAKLKRAIEQIDSNAFILEHTVNDTKGGMIKKRAVH